MNLNPKKKRKLEHKQKTKKREAKEDPEDDEVHMDKDKKKQRKDPSVEVDFSKIPKPDYSYVGPIKKSFWEGESAQASPSDELKELRKSLGVLVKGTLSLCPPPIVSLDQVGCPDCFRLVFKYLSLSAPSAVQKQCWPAALAGSNVLGIAPTGSGKTLAFVLPMIPHINHQIEANLRAFSNTKAPAQSTLDKLSPMALVLVPTRELALQITSACQPLRKLFHLHAASIYGGTDKEKQLEELGASGGVRIAVATPGRLLDLVATRQLSLSKVTYFVIDEADRMLQMGFADQLSAISNQIRPDRQTLLFSATFPGRLREASETWVGDATFIRCNTIDIHMSEQRMAGAGEGAGAGGADKTAADSSATHAKAAKTEARGSETAGETRALDTTEVEAEKVKLAVDMSSLAVSESIDQSVHVCATHKKPRLLIKFIMRMRAEEKEQKVRQPGSMIVFCTKIKTINFVNDFLHRQDVKGVTTIHGQMPQAQREKAIQSFRCGKDNILLATDVAARGLHIKKLKYVVNYDFPTNLEQYCHRIGRTGRQGEKGQAYSLISRNMAPMVKDLIQLLESCNQVVEPNLLALHAEFQNAMSGEAEGEAKEDDDNDDEDDET